jgi:hypothetical protein
MLDGGVGHIRAAPDEQQVHPHPHIYVQHDWEAFGQHTQSGMDSKFFLPDLRSIT